MIESSHSGFYSNDDLASIGKGIALGLFLGKDDDLPWELRQQGKALGITHFMAASGANLHAVWLLGQFLSCWRLRWWREAWGCAFLVLYLSLAGLSPSLSRAAWGWMYRLIGAWSGNRSSWLSESCATVALTWLFQRSMLGEAGWHLSFLATSGVFFSQFFSSGENNGGLFPHSFASAVIAKTGLVTGWWVFLCVVPYTWWFFQSARPLSILVTPTLEPMVRPFQGVILTGSLFSLLWDESHIILASIPTVYHFLAWTWLWVISAWTWVLNSSLMKIAIETAILICGCAVTIKGFIRFLQKRQKQQQWESKQWV